MKKTVRITLFLFILSCTVSKVYAHRISFLEAETMQQEHEHHGRFFAGGAFTFWNNTKDKKLTLDLCPEIGYLFNENWGAGMLLGYEFERQGSSFTMVREHALKISPFVRYYYLHRMPFNLYVDSGIGFNYSCVRSQEQKENLCGFEVGLRPGVCVDLTKGLCLCLRMGFIGYRNQYFMGEEPKIGDKGFGLRFTPEELIIGLELEF